MIQSRNIQKHGFHLAWLVALAWSSSLAAPVWASAETTPAKLKPQLPGRSELARAFEAHGTGVWRFAPGSAAASRQMCTTTAAPWDMRPVRALSVQARYLGDTSRGVRLRWLVRSRIGGLYAAAQAETLAMTGERTEARLLFEPLTCDLVAVGHQRPWDIQAAAEILSIELRAESGGGKPVEVELHEPRLVLATAAGPKVQARLLDVEVEPAPFGVQAEATLTFRIDPQPEDPFAAEGEGEVRVRPIAGNGREGEESLAFFAQDYTSISDGSAEREMATGSPRFRAHLTQLPAGGSLRVISGANGWTIPVTALGQSGPRSAPPAKLEPQPVRWRVPLEIALAATSDSASAGLWAGAPRAWRFSPSGTESWVVAQPPAATDAWRPVTFWNASWGEYGGWRRPDFVLALRMDALLALAAARGQRQPLVVLDGEGFSRQGVFTWGSHPLNVAQGGALAGPGALLRTPEGLDFCRRSARYAVARWGRSKAVSSFLITTALNAPGAGDLHARLGATARTWPEIAAHERDRPLYSLHPLAREPLLVAQVDAEDPGVRTLEHEWTAGEPGPARVRRVDAAGGVWGREEEGGVEAVALGRAASICALKPMRFAKVDYRSRAPDDFGAADALLFDVWLPHDAPPDLRAGIHLRDRDGLWFQALLPGLLRPGDWNICMANLTGRNLQNLQGVGHAKPWTEYSRARITELGLHVYTTHPERLLSARFARVRAVRFDRLELAPAVRIELVGEPQRMLRRGEKWECYLKVNRTYPNPFDAQQVDLAALITLPSGKTLRVPAFFDQPCRRREEGPGGAERVEPVGEERWTVRFRAQEEGAHAITFELREGGKFRVSGGDWVEDKRFSREGLPFPPVVQNEDDWVYGYAEVAPAGRRRVERVHFEPGAVAATLPLPGGPLAVGPAAGPWRGFVRVDKDGRHLRFDDGSFFFALGPCLRSPSDNRLPYADPRWTQEALERLSKRGTYQYDEYFEAFEQAGINWARVWMCSWWGGLQWRRDWPGYGGLGRYNLLNAWRMDHVLDEAERRGVRINLCLTNHGQFSYVIDTEWKHNPYNRELGGPLNAPSEFFTRAAAKQNHQNMLRYIVARWGHSPAVLTWVLFSELEFTDEYRSSLARMDKGNPDLPAPQIDAWHVEMAEYLKALDPYRHLVSTHYSHPVRGSGAFHLPQVELAMSNAYSAFDELAGGGMDAAAALADYWGGSNYAGGLFRGMRVYRKPVLVEEQGRHWMGVDLRRGQKHNTRAQLDADLHAGLWGSLVQPLAGATGYWWWLHVHFDNRYGEYRALAAYLREEDLRASAGEKILEPELVSVESAGAALVARALRSDRRAYVWVYHRQTPFQLQGLPAVNGGILVLKGLRPGAYAVEFWDTRTGKPCGAEQGTVETPVPGGPSTLTISLPVVKGDLALKIKPKG